MTIDPTPAFLFGSKTHGTEGIPPGGGCRRGVLKKPRALKRPSRWCSTATLTPKASETCSLVSTSVAGPKATGRPSRRSRAWLMPDGSSSR